MKKFILLAVVATIVGTSCAESKDAVADLNPGPELIYFDAVAVDDNAAADTTQSQVITVKINP